MRYSNSIFLATLLIASPAAAQVAVDMRALTPGQPAQAAPAQAPATPAPHPGTSQPPAPATRRQPAAAPAAHAVPPRVPASPHLAPATAGRRLPSVATPGSPLPALPGTPPSNVTMAPIPPPSTPARPLVPPPISNHAGGSATPLGREGLRVEFMPDHSDLTPETLEALRQFADSVPKEDGTILDVRTYSAPVPNDQSVPRRLSLERSLAIRAALLAQGVPSPRIYLRSLVTPPDDGPANRSDITVVRPGERVPPLVENK